MNAPAYIARDGMIVPNEGRDFDSLTLSEAADRAEAFTRMAAETASPALARSGMRLATDIITAIHAVRAEMRQPQEIAA